MHQSINRNFSSHNMLFDGHSFHLVPCNGNLIGQNSQKLNIDMIPPANQTRFSSKQLSGFPPSRSQSTNLFMYKMTFYPYFLFLSFHRRLDKPYLPNFMYIYEASPYWNLLFPELTAAFLPLDVNRQILNFG